MLKARIIYIGLFIAFSALLFFSPNFYSSAVAGPQHVRIIVHEHRLHFQEIGCLDQHLKEHLYSRLVDKELSDRGHTAFSVEAVAAIDKIIIGVEHWGEPDELASIADAAVEGIKNHPPTQLVEQERILVNYEDELLTEVPQLGSSVTAALINIAASSNFSCPAERVRSAAGSLTEWAPGDFEVYEFHEGGQYTRLALSQTSMSAFPNAWDGLLVPPLEESQASAEGAPNTLFVAYKGGANSLSTIKLLAAILNSIVGSEVEAKDVQPFGKAGFVVRGEHSGLLAIKENILTALRSPTPSQTQPNGSEMARESVCGFRFNERVSNARISDEPIAHTYFEFNSQRASCGSDVDLGNAPADLIVISNLMHIAETGFRSPSYASSMSFDMCIPKEGFERENLSIAAYALRQHLRFDAGLALNIQFSRIEGNCVTGSIFAPASNAGDISRILRHFEAANDAYKARLSTAEIIYHCSKSNSRNCRNREKYISGNFPELTLVVK